MVPILMVIHLCVTMCSLCIASLYISPCTLLHSCLYHTHSLTLSCLSHSLVSHHYSVAATLVADLVRSGIKIERGAQAGTFDLPQQSGRAPIRITLEAPNGDPRPAGLATELKCDAYLAAVGRKPNTGNLNLQSAGIQVDEYGGILVNSLLCTTAKAGNVYAAGDVVGRPFLASTGVAQAKAVVNAMFNNDREMPICEVGDETCAADGFAMAGTAFDPASLAANPFAFPTGVWSSPEAAYFGLSLQQAQKMGLDAGEGIALYAECLRGRVFSPNGLLKLVFEKPAGRILGVHICGDDACELIHYGMELVKSRRTVVDLSSSLYSAVTFHEMYKIAAQAALDEAGARKRRAAAGASLAKRNRVLRSKADN
jgi:NAD(P) transhydrogenase